MVSFAEAAVLWLLIGPLVLIAVVLLRHRKRLAQQRSLASPAVWDRLMGGAPATGVWRMAMWCLAAASLVLALARPQWGEIPSEESIRTRDLVLAIDVSDSMLCPDVGPSRLAKAMEIIHRSLPSLEGNRVGVVVFAGEAYALVPLTTDLEAVAAFLAGITPGMVGRPGSNLEAAVAAAVRLLPAEGDGRVVMFFTDGENLQGNVETASKTVSDAGATVVGVVLGTERGGPIPVVDDSGSVTYKRNREGQPVVTRAEASTLRSMADVVGGEVVVADQGEPVARIREAIEAVRTREVETRRTPRKVERFPIFLTLAALFVLVAFLLSPWRRKATVAVVLIGVAAGAFPVWAQGLPPAQPPAPATQNVDAAGQESPGGPPVPWWQRLIPGGSRRLARQGAADWRDDDLEGAVEGFAGAAVLAPEDPERIYDLGTALGAAGAAEPALQLLQQAENGGVVGASYNAGTVALTGGQAEPAVQSLRRALMANPEDPDVKRNYELALRLLEQQQQQQEDDPKKDDQQEQEKDEQEQENEPQPTPTPEPGGGDQAPQPTPTPDPNEGLFSALDRAEAEARDAMRTPTPQAATVEKDW